MANKTIPQLPEQTGKTDNDLLAIVDSGETTTSKIKVSTLIGSKVDTLEGLSGDLVFSGNNITIGTSGTDTITFDAGGGGLVAAPGTNSYKSVNIPDADVVGDNTFYIGNNVNATDGITSTSGSNIIIGNGKITTGANNAIFGASNQDASISDSSLAGNVVIQQGRINAVGLRGAAIIQSDQGDINGGSNSIMMGGYFNNMNGEFNFMATNNAYTDINGGFNVSISNQTSCDINGSYNVLLSSNSPINGNGNAKISGYGGSITANYSGTFVGSGNTITHDRSVILGGSGLSSNTDDEVQVPNLTIANYASLNYADDAAAAAAGLPLGAVYHTSGTLKVRIT